MKLQTTSFLLGACVVATVAALVGARAPSAAPTRTYDAYIGIGGFQILDHSTNTFYLYDPNAIMNQNGDAGSMKLRMSVDLSKAGDKQLNLTQFKAEE